jgi:hypothetical protein
VGHQWIQSFFWAWFADGAMTAENPEAFVSRWMEMMAYALEQPQWGPPEVHIHQIEEMVEEMLGLGFGVRTIMDSAAYSAAIGMAVPLFRKAVARWLKTERLISGFAAFVVRPGGSELLRPGIQWLNGACTELKAREEKRSGLDGQLVNALAACWDRHAADVAADADLRKSAAGAKGEGSPQDCVCFAPLPGRLRQRCGNRHA